MRRLFTLSLVLLFAGCSLPSLRVFQKKVPADTGPSATVVEAQRRSAALIVDLSATPSADPVARIAEIHAVAVPLSTSLGEPLKRATVFEAPAVIAASRASVLEAQAKADKWREFSRKYAGKPLEDTGIDLAGPTGILALIAVIAACVAFPPLAWALLRLIPVLWGALKRSASFVESIAERAPELVSEMKSALPQKEDAVRKVVRAAKASPAPR